MHNKRSEKAMVILDQMQNSFVNAKELIRDFFRPISVLRLSDNIDEQRARGGIQPFRLCRDIRELHHVISTTRTPVRACNACA
jgi:hypothetical protein